MVWFEDWFFFNGFFTHRRSCVTRIKFHVPKASFKKLSQTNDENLRIWGHFNNSTTKSRKSDGLDRGLMLFQWFFHSSKQLCDAHQIPCSQKKMSKIERENWWKPTFSLIFTSHFQTHIFFSEKSEQSPLLASARAFERCISRKKRSIFWKTRKFCYCLEASWGRSYDPLWTPYIAAKKGRRTGPVPLFYILLH